MEFKSHFADRFRVTASNLCFRFCDTASLHSPYWLMYPELGSDPANPHSHLLEALGAQEP